MKDPEKMTDDELQVAVAAELGWKEAFPSHREPHPETKRGGIMLPYRWVNEITHERLYYLPDFQNDLNACHAFEEVIKKDNPYFYSQELFELTGGSEGPDGEDESSHMKFDLLHASARQRCVAFLRVRMGLRV